MQLQLFVDPNDIIRGSYRADASGQWDANDVRCHLRNGKGHRNYRRPTRARKTWAVKRSDVGGYRPRYQLNDTPLPFTFINGRPVLGDGHHRVVLAAERGQLLPVLHGTWDDVNRSVGGRRHWHKS